MKDKIYLALMVVAIIFAILAVIFIYHQVALLLCGIALACVLIAEYFKPKKK